MLQPKRTKFRKQLKGRNTGKMNSRANKVSFGDFGFDLRILQGHRFQENIWGRSMIDLNTMIWEKLL